MTTPNLQVRRATVDDLPTLAYLCQQDQLPCEDLEQRFKEFQVVQGEDGQVLGALAFQHTGLEGLLHSEVFLYPEQADLIRERLWERTQILANNHGLVRIWTRLATPFWRGNGFRQAGAEVLAKLPPSFGQPHSGWLFLQLKDQEAPAISVDKEFALFKETEKEQTQKMFRQAKVLKMIAAVLGVAVFVLVIIWAFMFMKAQGRLPRP